MEGYQGEFDVDVATTPYVNYLSSDWAMEFIGCYGQIDGDHHKAWVLDQAARILRGTPVILKEARWSNGHKEYRFWTGEPSQAYLEWVREMKGEYDEVEEEYEYDYNEGTPP